MGNIYFTITNRSSRRFIVENADDCTPSILCTADHIQHGLAVCRIEAGSRLVEEQNLRVRRERARQCEALRLTAQDLKKLGVVDRIIPEPVGGAQRHRTAVISAVGKALEEMLAAYDGKKRSEIVAARRSKFLEMGRKGLAA